MPFGRHTLSTCFFASAIAVTGCRGDDTAPARPEAPAEEPAAEGTGRDGDLHIGDAFQGVVLEGTGDGTRDLQAVSEGAADCVGLVLDEGRNHRVRVDSAQALTLEATPLGVGTVDLLLAVRGQDGTWRCADDATSLDPIFADRFEPGTYDIFVATAGNTIVPYSLRIRPGVHVPDPIALGGRFPAPITDGTPAERTAEGTFGGLRVPGGVAAATLPGQAGGTRPAGAVDPLCKGFIAQTPDHVIELTAAMELTFRVRSDGDTTLAIQGPAGGTWCADDEDGLNPVVRDAFTAGRYSVYVGTYIEGEAPSYTLTVTR